MSVRDFYITLPSDSSLFVFPKNTPSNFKTKLSTPLQLKGEWEVALTEITYTHSFYNIWDSVSDILFTDGIPNNYAQAFKIPDGFYSHSGELIFEIEKGIRSLSSQASNRIDLQLEKYSRRLKVHGADGQCSFNTKSTYYESTRVQKCPCIRLFTEW